MHLNAGMTLKGPLAAGRVEQFIKYRGLHNRR